MFCVFLALLVTIPGPARAQECNICNLLLDVPPGYEELTPGPTPAPTAGPTPAPTAAPSLAPTAAPSSGPTPTPTPAPTGAPTATRAPSPAPTNATAFGGGGGSSEGPTKQWWDSLDRTHIILILAGTGLVLCGGIYSKWGATDPDECDERDGPYAGSLDSSGSLPSEERQWRFGRPRIGDPTQKMPEPRAPPKPKENLLIAVEAEEQLEHLAMAEIADMEDKEKRN